MKGKRPVVVGDTVYVPMQVVKFESQGPGRKRAICVKLPGSRPHRGYDHRLTRDKIQLSADLEW